MSKWMEKLHIEKATLIKGTIAVILYFVIVFALELLVGVAAGVDTSSVYFKVWIYALVAAGYLTFLVRKNFYKYAHVYVAALIILLGVVQIVVTPPVIGVSWDDEIHYKRAAFLSWGANGNIAPADLEMFDYFREAVLDRKEYTADGREAWVDYIDTYAKENSILIKKDFALTKEYVAYIPAAIGLGLGHLLNLTFTQTFMLGKLFNLLCYAIMVGVALKQLERGKIIAALIAMFPTNIFLASAYSYDWWVTGFVLLAYAFFLGDIQKERKITNKKLLLILALMVLGLLPKAVYFLLIAPMLFWKDDKFENPKVSRIMIIGAMVLLLASFLIPMLIGGAGGDMRGGTDVNGNEQVKFILTHPFNYVIIVAKFLLTYLTPDAMFGYTTFYAYAGKGSFSTIVLPLIAVACALDNDAKAEDKKERIWTTIMGFLAVAGSILLVITAMYVSFTPVGFGTVNGCQTRYLTPILFPGMYLLCKMKIDVPKKIKENVCLISVCALALVCLYNMLELCVMALCA